MNNEITGSINALPMGKEATGINWLRYDMKLIDTCITKSKSVKTRQYNNSFTWITKKHNFCM